MSHIVPVEADRERERRAAGIETADPPAAASGTKAALPVAGRVAVGILVTGATALLLVALVPQDTWKSMQFPADGPIPHALVPLEAPLFYLIPALVGALCRRWQVALVLATAPAWIDLGVFAVAAAGQLSPFYLVQSHPDGSVGTLELYAALGGVGWLARYAVLFVWRNRARLAGSGGGER
jgi:hypothetical protein